MSPRQREKLSEKYVKEMEECIQNGDTEDAHSSADALLCELLVECGFEDVVKKYREVEKWYA